jgi:putative membrane protein
MSMRHPPHARGCDLPYTSTNNIMTIQAKSFMHTAILAAALACADVATAQAPATRQGGATRPEAAPTGQPGAPRMEVSKREREFFKNSSELGMAEVEMGKMGQAKATDPDLKKFSAELARDHTKANNELMTLAKQKGVQVAAEPTSAQRKMISQIAAKSGPEFDTEFREQLVKSHEKGIRMLQEAERDAKDPDVKAWAAKQLPIMQEHLAMAKGQRMDTRTTERGPSAPSRESSGSGRVKTP